jgi:hypothetical protein
MGRPFSGATHNHSYCAHAAAAHRDTVVARPRGAFAAHPLFRRRTISVGIPIRSNAAAGGSSESVVIWWRGRGMGNAVDVAVERVGERAGGVGRW